VSGVTRFSIGRPGDAADADPGVVANARLTSSTGLLLTVLLLIEGFTILDVRGYLTLHTVIGLMLIGPVALKCATTIYRFARYYTGNPGYRRRGAPALILRLIGPFVVLSSVTVLGTGIALLVLHSRSGTWFTLHKGSFLVWIALTAVHFLGHIYNAIRETAHDLRSRSADPFVRGRAIRLLVLTTSLAVGIALAAAFTPSASSWKPTPHDHRGSSARPP
jgi:hypothetical protein